MKCGAEAALLAAIAFALPELGAAQEDERAELSAESAEASAEFAEANGTQLSGETLFLVCAGCHSLDPANSELVGPHLAGIVGRQAGAVDGYPYSEALAGAAFAWERNLLFSWIVAAESLVPGTHMLHHSHLEPAEVFRLIDFLEGAARPGNHER